MYVGAEGNKEKGKKKTQRNVTNYVSCSYCCEIIILIDDNTKSAYCRYYNDHRIAKELKVLGGLNALG